MFEQFYSKNHDVGYKWNDGMIPWNYPKLLASFQKFLQSLRECAKETFNSYPGTFESNKLVVLHLL